MAKIELLLSALGARIRAARASRGWSQRELGSRSGISLRFLGQLEGGRANVSVARLVEIAEALELSLVSLLAGLGPIGDDADRLAASLEGLDATRRLALLASVAPPRPDKLALVGLRGAGKSTVGALAAERLGCSLVVLDDAVRQRSGLSLADLFELHGPGGYHRLCRELLGEVVHLPGPVILEIGGSVVADAEAWALLERHTTVVWLQATATAHLERVAAQGDTRPMEGHPDAVERLRAILAEREPLYRRADQAVDTVALGLEGSVAAVVAACREAASG